ncbi:Uncharacterised protein [Mycoplasmoides gallisepticum]|uniref:Uncharacterized protein n=1 Tax=Mycoplasmoides gallisepticum TaxID=2096 RepID=A0A3B0PDL2_MYCGL|nr:Uncharacterised protein [Mycoplasmoides gallisepticum]
MIILILNLTLNRSAKLNQVDCFLLKYIRKPTYNNKLTTQLITEAAAPPIKRRLKYLIKIKSNKTFVRLATIDATVTKMFRVSERIINDNNENKPIMKKPLA